MDSAYLHDSVFNIEVKRKEMEQQNLSRNEIIRSFESRYRVFSKKGAFTCLCCNQPVNMNLTKDEGRPFYFRHFDDIECSYSKNTKTYEKQIAEHENKAKKDIGLTIFREILEGNLKPFGAVIERGFHYKKKLSFIPDFIVRFPGSEQLWAIDYYTAIGQGLVSGSYARHLAKRMKTYEEEGFKVFPFVDSGWLSLEEETNKGTLLAAETYVSSKTKEDHLWDSFLKENLQGELLYFFMNESGSSSRYFSTQSIVYVDTSDCLCTIFRFIETSHNNRNMTFYNLSSSVIPLEEALKLSSDYNQFMFAQVSEEDKRNEFLNNLIIKKQQIEFEQHQKEEEEARRKVEEKEELARLKVEKDELLKLEQRVKELEDEQVEREMQERARLAALRPMEIDPNRWERRYQNQNAYSHSNYVQKSSVFTFESIDKQIENKKKEKVKDLLLTQPITGETYIEGDKEYWRKVILKWINENQMGDFLETSISKLIQYMKNNGVSFNQHDKLVQYPIKHFLNYYQKTIKTELKKKVQLYFSD